MSRVIPRDYQREAHAAARKSWANGVQRPAVVLPTGTGKTVVIGEVTAEELNEGYSSRVLVLAHRDELIRQAVADIRSVAPDLRVGVVKGDEDHVGAPVIVGSVQTMRHEARRRRVRNVGLVIVDECFPAGTLVGGKPIETLAPGDVVPSYDETTGECVMRPVVALMSRRPQHMVRVVLDDGRQIDCTPGHPILTDNGWCPAGWLSRGAQVVSFKHDATARGTMHRVRENRSADSETEDRQLSADGSDVLLRWVSGYVGQEGPIGADESHESGSRVSADDRAQSDATGGCTGQDGEHSACQGASSGIPGWERETGPVTAESVSRASGMAYGSDGYDRRRRKTLLVQRGHCASVDDGRDRGERGIPLLARTPRLGSSQAGTPYLARVAAVHVLESGSDGTYGGVCADGAVYNIEVEGTHTYLVTGGLVVHNCHHATASSYRTVLEHYGCFSDGGARALGFTATMSRGDGVGLGEVWQEIAYSRDINYMITRGFLVKPKGIHVRVDDLDLSRVRKKGGDFSKGELGEALAASMAPERIVDAYKEHATGRPTLLFVPTVELAEVMAERLETVGVVARVVHGAQPIERRRRALADFTAGRVAVLVNCMVLTEGTNLPAASCVIIARPTTHVGLFVQMVGRVLRLYPGKKDALVLDVVGVSKRHALASLIDLIGERDSTPREDGEPDELSDVDGLEFEETDARAGFRDRAWLDGFLVSEEVDLFHGQRARWQQTYGGQWFAPYGKERYITVVPALNGSDAWDVISVDRRRTGESDWIVREVPDLGYAMAHGESVILAQPFSLAKRDARWRKNPASNAQKDLLRRYGAILPEGALSGEASDVLDVIYASQRIDPWARKR